MRQKLFIYILNYVEIQNISSKVNTFALFLGDIDNYKATDRYSCNKRFKQDEEGGDRKYFEKKIPKNRD